MNTITNTIERATNVGILASNPILATDSYKLSHYGGYPKNVKGMFSYIEARSKGDTIVVFGTQMWVIKNLLSRQITMAHIDEAEAFAKAHGEPFERAGWERVVKVYNGYIPVRIRAVPEGTRVPSGQIIVSIECTDRELFWLASYIETSLLRGIWYPTTIASNDYKNWRVIRRFASETSDTLDLVPFTLHDFGGRGVTCSEQAEIGGAAHTVFFKGSDTIEGIRAANHYYFSEMAAFSVVATEHSIQCSYGPSRQREYLEHIINTFAKPGAIVSIVLDGYDVYREAQTLCEMRDKIVASGARIVFRPDSGDPLEVIPRLLRMQELAFGTTRNTKGYKVINNVGIIQGDGVDLESMSAILEKITEMGYSASNIVFGSGGGLLQKVNRDTFKFAQKASAVQLISSEWQPIFKDPVTDPGKTSKKGRLTLVRSKVTGEYCTAQIDSAVPLDVEWEDVMVDVYDCGKLLYASTLEEIRERATTL